MYINETERNYLSSSIESLVEEYGYRYTSGAINTIIDEWVCQKGWLIELFKKHPNYVEGKFMIAFDVDYDRELNTNALYAFGEWIRSYPAVELKDSVPEEIIKQRKEDYALLLPDKLYEFFQKLDTLTTRTLSDERAEELNSMVPAVHAHPGQKTSRVINKLCTYLGYNKHPDYNREFAKYADALNPLTIKRHTVLSLNPLDYLTMSFGNSWASCHTIDKNNKRGMPNDYSGCYSSGTVSYMLDGSSMILYTVDASYDGKEYWTQPKINRQMFHYGEDKLVQSRLYPQSNDGYSDMYAPYRNIVQEIMSTILEVPNLWTLKRGTSAASKYIESHGTHYCDYCNFDSCTLSTLKGSDNESEFIVGARPICIECGDRHTNAECINCCHGVSEYTCEHCGCRIDEEDVRWVNDEPYCSDCANYCERCGEYHRGEEYWIDSENRYVCEECLDNYYTYCDECEEYHRRGDVTYLSNYDIYVCDTCLEDEYVYCDHCGKYVRPDDAYQLDDNTWYCDRCHEMMDEEAC